jgi:hypothetical protein
MEGSKDQGSNKLVKIILAILGILIVLILLDFLVLKLIGFGPIFSVKDKSSTDSIRIYNALFYKAYKCDAKKNPHDVVIKLFRGKYDCDVVPVKNLAKNDFIIEDETDKCANGLQEITRDDIYIYSLKCMRDTTVFLRYGNGDKISVKDALADKKVTVKKLMDKGLTVYQEVIDK